MRFFLTLAALLLFSALADAHGRGGRRGGGARRGGHSHSYSSHSYSSYSKSSYSEKGSYESGDRMRMRSSGGCSSGSCGR